MKTFQPEKQIDGFPLLLTLASLLLGGGALWLSWVRFDQLSSQPDVSWYAWVQLAAIGLVGVLCLGAGVLFVLRQHSAPAVFKLGISIVPIILFVNLIVFVLRGVQNIFQGNFSFLERILAQPQKLVFIVIVIIALSILGSLTEVKGKQ